MSEVVAAKTSKSRWMVWTVVGLMIVGAGGYLIGQAGTFKSKPKLAIVTWNQDPFWDLVIKGAQDAAKAYDVELTTIRSDPTEEAQTKHLRDLLAQGVNGVAVSPNDPTKQVGVLDEVAAKATLITFDSDAPNSKRRGFVGSDDYAAGRFCGQEIRDALPGGGAVLITVGNAAMVNAKERRQGVIDELLDRSFRAASAEDAIDAPAKGAKYSVVMTVLDGGDPAKAATLIADGLKAHPEVKAIAALYSYSGPAAVKGIAAAGRAGQVKVVSFDASDETQAAVEKGEIASSIVQNQYRCGFETVRLLAESVRGHQTARSDAYLALLPVNLLEKDSMVEMRKRDLIATPAGGK